MGSPVRPAGERAADERKLQPRRSRSRGVCERRFWASENEKENMIKRFVSAIASRAGYRIIPSWRLPSLDHSEFLGQVMGLYGVDLVLDVGANVGQYHDYLRANVGYNGQVISFEPNPHCVSQLRARLPEDPLWSVEPVALGEREATLTLNIMRSSSFSSFRAPDATAVPELEELNTIVGRCEVPVRRLDDIDVGHNATPSTATFLKLDTQGYDLEVLKGATGLFDRIVAVQTEASVLPIYADMPDIVETIKALAGYGYSLAHAAPVTRDGGLRAVEFDLVFINDSWATRHTTPAGGDSMAKPDSTL